MSKLDLTNKVSPCCKRKIKYHEICRGSHYGFDYYTCSYCEGELTRTQILRANIEEEKPIKSEDKFSALEERLEKLEAKFKVNEYEERQKIREYINNELEKFDNKKMHFEDRYRIQNEIMRMVQDLIRKLDEE